MLISNQSSQSASAKKRILVVNCYFDDSHRPLRRTLKVPQAMGPAYLAGAFSREHCEVRTYSELYSGPLEDERLLAWPDMLVLTGLTNSLDRMLHVTAYARTKNPNVIVVAGGAPIRAFPRFSSNFFDYCCQGDVEQLRDVISVALGRDYAAEEVVPRYDLAYWMGRLGHVESSRNCNFRCSFCALTGEGRGYQKYDLENVRKQILALGKKPYVHFIDNNFYGNDRNYFLARLELIKEMRAEGYLKHWAALVTNDFFYKDENLRLVREAGCISLFSGVESFDTEWLRAFNKMQNTRVPQVEMISKCLDSGIVFLYGLILDATTREVSDLRRELRFITATPEITLPSFLSMVIAIPGTPFFNECLEKGAILPNTRLRDLDGTTISLRPLSPMDEVTAFLRDIQNFRGYRRRALEHSLAFRKKYRLKLSAVKMVMALSNAAILCAPVLAVGPGWKEIFGSSKGRTFISSTEPLEGVYTPAFRVASRYERYFKPTMVTDSAGHLSEELVELGKRKESDVTSLVSLGVD